MRVRERQRDVVADRRDAALGGSARAAASESASVVPSTSSMTMNGRPSSTPVSKTVTIPGWESRATSRASRAKRSRAELVLRERGGEELDRDVPVEDGVAGAAHLAHPAAAEGRAELVAAGEERAQPPPSP